MEQFCKSLPKVELHAHLNGSLSKDTLISLGCLESNVKQYQKLGEILSKTTRTLDECFQLFDVAHRATSNVDAVYKATQCVITEFAEDGVIYLELRTTPRREEAMSFKEYVEAVIKGVEDISDKLPIVVRLILCLNRSFAAALSSEVMNLIIEMHQLHPGTIVGVDLCGNPKVGCFPKEEFAKARQHGLRVTLHCGEVKADAEEEKILEFMPERLGHGTFLHPAKGKNEKCFNIDVLKKVPLEVCLSSNVICGTVDSFQNHHIKKWLENELPFCLCTDDKGVFMSDLSAEYYLAHRNCGFTREDLYELSLQSVDYIFADERVKERLRARFREWRAAQSFF